MTKPKLPARRNDEPRLGPKMMALPRDSWREFVRQLFLQKPGHGLHTRALRAAGLCPGSNKARQARTAYDLTHDQRVIEAVAEESRKYVRVGAPSAVTALLNLVRDPSHRDHGRAIALIMDRVDPIETKHLIDVTHRHVTLDDEALEALRTMRAMKATHEQLVEFFGEAGLRRYENMLAEEAKAVEGEVIEGKAP